MYLKKIISSGFKSFADKVTINLEKNHITGIVGPNGSGKSNVIDSVRWVMGEQNAKMLRGEKATDIIFAGSEKRKALGMAEVTLTFDNQEGSSICPAEFRSEPEISLTRRLYADGQREYLINKKPCRLKDIIGFFTATGLGGRSYSMIQQGQVDRILQARPEQLREIIEEAAGTLIFKKRRNEAEKKLNNTKQNLSRIDDLISELDRQKRALNDQVQKAKKWQERNDKLIEQESKLLIQNYRYFSEQSELINSEIQKLKTEEISLHSTLSKFEIRLEKLHLELAEADPEVQALGEEITVLREKIASSEASLFSSISLLENGDKRQLEFRAELEEDLQQQLESEKTYKASKEKLEEAELAAEHANKLIETFDQRMEEFSERSQVFQNKSQEMTEEINHLTRLVDQKLMRIEDTQLRIKDNHNSIDQIRRKLASSESDFNQSSILAESASLNLSTKQNTLKQTQQEKNSLSNKINDRSAELNKLNAKKDDVKQKFMSLTAKIDALAEIRKSNDHTIDAMKYFVNQSENNAFILTDFISLNEESAIMPKPALSAFESWAERIYLLKPSHFEDIARQCEKKGSTGFSVTLNLDYDMACIKHWCEEHGAIPMATFTRCESSSLQPLINRLAYIEFGKLENYDQLPAGLIVFTSNGLTISGGGDDIYLSNEKDFGTLSLKKDLDNLTKSAGKADQDLGKLTDKITNLKTLQDEDHVSLHEHETLIQKQNNEVIEAMSAYENSRNTAELNRENLTNLREQINSAELDLEKFVEDVKQLEHESDSLQSQKEKLALEREQLILDNESLTEESEELKRQHETAIFDQAAATTRAKSLRDGFAEQQLRLDSINSRVNKKKEGLTNLLSDIEKAKINKETLEKDIEAFIYRREELEDTLTNKRESNASLIDEMRNLEAQTKDSRTKIQKNQKSIGNKEIEAERALIALNAAKDQALEKYQIKAEDSEIEIPDEFDSNKVSKAVSNLRAKIESMGPINMMAIEEYEKLEERSSFISKQRQEVQSSVDLLELAIEEIEEHSTDKFILAFNTLNKEFSELFPILFPGGDAAIILTNEDNPIDGGVEIMVRLPGKKRQSMRLFSGGEKALTAIALIFGLLKSKPTPFCFLDEVDAPLDETNVGRYNKVLEILAKKFQFIVITHNRRTMEVLNTLYGITMQEPGVSKVVGVDLEKTIPPHLQKAFKDLKPGASSM